MSNNEPPAYLLDIARAEIGRAGEKIIAAIDEQDRLCQQIGLSHEERLRFKKILLECLRERISVANGS
jgi:hypothetical protein